MIQIKYPEILEYTGITVSTKNTDYTSGVSSAITDIFTIKKDKDYVLQFKIVNLTVVDLLNYIVISDGINNQYLSDIRISDFEIVGTLESKYEVLCYLKLKASFTSSTARLAIGRRHISSDVPNSDLFIIRHIKLEEGSVLNGWQPATKDTSAEIKILSDEITMKVSKGELSSLIKQDATSVQYAFNNISPSVTIDALGLTLGKNCRVATDSITCTPGSNPIIKLFATEFTSGLPTQYCSIDATSNNEQGFGSAIRLKWDRNNYVLVKDKAINMYVGDNKARIVFAPVDSSIFTQRLYVGEDTNSSFIVKGHAYIDQKLNIGTGSNRARFDPDGSALRIWASSSDTGLRIHDDGNIGFYYNGRNTHYFYSGGTKYGGSIELDGVTFGMSPVDSPQMLIEDILFDIDVNKEDTVIYLDNTLARCISKYAVFPSNGNVEVISKDKNSFTVKGYDGKCDFRVVGKRIGREHAYFGILGGDA